MFSSALALIVIISIAFAAFGAVLASFTGVIAERIYTGQSWMKGRSRCNACKRQLTFIDLIPVFSWLAFGGRCRTCRACISARYTLFESAFALVFVLAYLMLGLSFQLIVFLSSVVVLGFIVLYDVRHTIVPFESMLLLVLLAALFAIETSNGLMQFSITLIVACAIGIAFFAVYFFSKGRAMGLGDAPVAFALSMLVGNQALIGLLFSFWVGALIGIGILVLRRGGPTMGIEVPFVPFLAVGYLLAFFIHIPWNPFLF